MSGRTSGRQRPVRMIQHPAKKEIVVGEVSEVAAGVMPVVGAIVREKGTRTMQRKRV